MKIKQKYSERGQGLVEYALILVLVAVVAVVILALLGEQVAATFNCLVIELQGRGGSTVSGFTLVDANADSDIGGLVCGGTVTLSALPSTDLNVRAGVNGTIGSMTFQLDGPTTHSRTENAAPYALFGNSGSDYYAGSFSAGNYTLTATAFSAGGGGGTELGSLTITFRVE